MTAERAPLKSTEKTRFANEMTIDEAWQLAKPKRWARSAHLSPILVQPYGVVPFGCARL
jgi:hypothetical protein